MRYVAALALGYALGALVQARADGHAGRACESELSTCAAELSRAETTLRRAKREVEIAGAVWAVRR